MVVNMNEKRVYAHWKVGVGSIDYYNNGTYKLKDHNNKEIDISQWSNKDISGFITKASVLIIKNDCPFMKE